MFTDWIIPAERQISDKLQESREEIVSRGGALPTALLIENKPKLTLLHPQNPHAICVRFQLPDDPKKSHNEVL